LVIAACQDGRGGQESEGWWWDGQLGHDILHSVTLAWCNSGEGEAGACPVKVQLKKEMIFCCAWRSTEMCRKRAGLQGKACVCGE